MIAWVSEHVRENQMIKKVNSDELTENVILPEHITVLVYTAF